MTRELLRLVDDATLVQVAASAYREWMIAEPRFVTTAEDAYRLFLDEVHQRGLARELMALTGRA